MQERIDVGHISSIAQMKAQIVRMHRVHFRLVGIEPEGVDAVIDITPFHALPMESASLRMRGIVKA